MESQVRQVKESQRGALRDTAELLAGIDTCLAIRIGKVVDD